MLIINKKVSETPLECLDRLRIEKPELKEEKLSYIGRLDPMAHGKMIVLVGDEENKNRSMYLDSDKEYIAKIVFGFKTDTNDILGLIEDKNADNSKLDLDKITAEIENFSKIKSQKYPWFSSKTFQGKSLFYWFKTGQKDIVDRPIRPIEIHSVSEIKNSQISKDEFHKTIKERINNLTGDFRQKEILENWEKDLENFNIQDLLVFEFKISVSTGTYIRGLVETLSETLDFPIVLFDLERTEI